MKHIIALCMLMISSYVSVTYAQSNAKRDWQKIQDSSVLHEGTFKGYARVYIVDFDDNSYSYAPNYTDDIFGYPVYKRSNGSYYIRYKGTKYTLNVLDDPIPLTRYSSLQWRFRSNYFIEEIPTSW